MSEPDRQRAIRQKVARMGEAPAVAGPPGPPLPTGFPSLDAATGGLPRASIVELFGAASSGKTTLALRIAAHLQRSGGSAAWIDAERCFDAAYAARLGVAVDRLPVAQPDSAEEALEMVRRLALSGAVDLLVVDSAAALVPRIELDTGIGTAGFGIHGRVLASGLRRLAAAVRRSGAVVLFLNQARTRIGPTGGDTETAAGGPPLKLFAALRIALRETGGRIVFRVRKNKSGGAFQEGELAWKDDAGFTERP
jgi:recombination protein RecA